MKRKELNFELPARLIAQTRFLNPQKNRLLVLSRNKKEKVIHACFSELPRFLNKGDVLVLNDTAVMPARFWGVHESGGQVEVTLVTRIKGRLWEALVRPEIRISQGTFIRLKRRGLSLRLIRRGKSGFWRVNFNQGRVEDFLFRYAEVNIPFYVRRQVGLQEYQNVYGRVPGSTQCPTAGLHFNKVLLRELAEKGVKIVFITLHVGGSILPVVVRDFRDLRIQREYFKISERAAAQLNEARHKGGKIFAVGTTVVRALESAVDGSGRIFAKKGWTALTLKMGHQFKAFDAFLTNFHMPGSSHLLMTSSFGGINKVLPAYRESVKLKYRFLDFGDSMLIL